MYLYPYFGKKFYRYFYLFLVLLIVAPVSITQASDDEELQGAALCPMFFPEVDYTYLRDGGSEALVPDEKVNKNYYDLYMLEVEKERWANYCLSNESNAPPYNDGKFHVKSGVGEGVFRKTGRDNINDPKPIDWVSGTTRFVGANCDVFSPLVPINNDNPLLYPEDCLAKGVTEDNYEVYFEIRTLATFLEAVVDTIDTVTIDPFNASVSSSVFVGSGVANQGYAPYFAIEGNSLCSYMKIFGLNARFVDCIGIIPPMPNIYIGDEACWVSPVCFVGMKGVKEAGLSNWVMPVSSMTIACLQNSLANIFGSGLGSESNLCSEPTMFESVQENFRDFASAVITLAFAMFFLKLMMGHGGDQKNVMESVVKFGLILYFVLGDGWQEYFMLLLDSSNTLAFFMMDASVGVSEDYGYCSFSLRDYPNNFQSSALWDIVDCKNFYYLGFVEGSYIPLTLLLPLAAIWVFAITVVIAGTAFAAMMLILYTYVLRVYVAFLFGVTILVFISPLTILASFFHVTNSIFQAWLSEFIGYLIYPAVFFAFIGMMYAVFDQIYWGDAIITNFDPKTGAIDVECKNNTDSLGCLMYGAKLTPGRLVFFPINFPPRDLVYNPVFLKSLLKGILFVILFISFLKELPSMIAGLTGTSTITAAMPTDPSQAIKNAVQGAASLATGVAFDHGQKKGSKKLDVDDDDDDDTKKKTRRT